MPIYLLVKYKWLEIKKNINEFLKRLKIPGANIDLIWNFVVLLNKNRIIHK